MKSGVFSRRELGFLSVIVLVFGVAVTLSGLASVCNCPEQSVGQPSNCSCDQSFTISVAFGTSLIVLSVIGVAYSLLRKGRPTWESDIKHLERHGANLAGNILLDSAGLEVRRELKRKDPRVPEDDACPKCGAKAGAEHNEGCPDEVIT